jgi:hypothetical protein
MRGGARSLCAIDDIFVDQGRQVVNNDGLGIPVESEEELVFRTAHMIINTQLDDLDQAIRGIVAASPPESAKPMLHGTGPGRAGACPGARVERARARANLARGPRRAGEGRAVAKNRRAPLAAPLRPSTDERVGPDPRRQRARARVLAGVVHGAPPWALVISSVRARSTAEMGWAPIHRLRPCSSKTESDRLFMR